MAVLTAMIFINCVVASLFVAAQPVAPLKTVQLLDEVTEQVRIVCFGDSITGRYYHSGNRRAWPEMLEIALAQLYPDADVRVINAGVSGNTSERGLERMQKDVLDRNPHLVIIMYGMNDLGYGTVTAEQDVVKKKAFTDNLRMIVNRCVAANVEVVLCTQNPIYPEALPRRPPERVAEFAKLIRETSTELNVPVVDVFGEWSLLKKKEPRTWRLLMSETIHPSMAGHKRIAEQVARILSGRVVSLADVKPEQPVCQKLIVRLEKGKPVIVAAPALIEGYIRKMVFQRFPSADLTVIPIPAACGSLEALVEEHKCIRDKSPHIVFVGLMPDLLTFDNEEKFIRNVSWVVNWSLPFAGTAWTAVGLESSFLSQSVLTPQQSEGVELLRKIVSGHDLDWIACEVSTPDRIMDSLNRWFDSQIKKHESRTAVP